MRRQLAAKKKRPFAQQASTWSGVASIGALSVGVYTGNEPQKTIVGAASFDEEAPSVGVCAGNRPRKKELAFGATSVNAEWRGNHRCHAHP